jgi:DNA-binding MarR family transcriptional regulator
MQKQAPTLSLLFEFGRLVRSRMRVPSFPTLPQLETLHFIAESGAEPSMRQLALYLKVKAPTATALVDDLVRAGLISRSGTRDRRVVSLSLTQKGRRMLKENTTRRARIIAGILSPLSARDRSEFDRLLRIVVSADAR